MHIQAHLRHYHALPDLCCDPFMAIDSNEVTALLKELEHQYITYENPTAIVVIQRMIRFRNELDKRNSSST